MNKLTTALLSGAFLFAGASAFAQDAMGHDAMSQGTALTIPMHKDSMAMDHMTKPKTGSATKHDAMTKDAMGHSADKDKMGHGAMTNDAMGHGTTGN